MDKWMLTASYRNMWGRIRGRIESRQVLEMFYTCAERCKKARKGKKTARKAGGISNRISDRICSLVCHGIDRFVGNETSLDKKESSRAEMRKMGKGRDGPGMGRMDGKTLLFFMICFHAKKEVNFYQ